MSDVCVEALEWEMENVGSVKERTEVLARAFTNCVLAARKTQNHQGFRLGMCTRSFAAVLLRVALLLAARQTKLLQRPSVRQRNQKCWEQVRTRIQRQS